MLKISRQLLAVAYLVWMILGQIISCCGPVLHIVEIVAGFLASNHWLPIASFPPVVTIKKSLNTLLNVPWETKSLPAENL